MGNDNTKEIDLTQPDGTTLEKCENGVNGISLTIKTNGLTVDVPTTVPVEKNEEPPSPDVKTESTEYAVLESQSEPTEAEAPVQTPELNVLSEVEPPKKEPVKLFSKMFKKKTPTATEKPKQELNGDQTDEKPEQQIPNGLIHIKQENGKMNGITDKGPEIQVPLEALMEQSVQPESTVYVVLQSQKSDPTETEAPVPTLDLIVLNEEEPPKKEPVSLFSKMFKKKAAAPTQKDKEPEKESHDQPDSNPANDPQQQNGENHEEQRNDSRNGDSAEPPAPEVKTEPTEYAVLESESKPTETEAAVQTPEPSVLCEVEPPRKEPVSLFSKMFKKKAPATTEKDKQPEEKDKEPEKTEEVYEDQADGKPTATDQILESGDLKPESEPEKVEEGESGPEPREEEEREEDRGSGNSSAESQDSPEEENPVMNFFKTLVTPTKTSKKEAPASDASKDQPQPPETQPAPATTTTTVAQVSDPPAAPKGMPAPPPPPPEPPRAEPAAKAAKPEEPKAAAKDSPKGKSSPRDTLSRLFRSKPKHKDAHPSVEEAPAEAAQETPDEEPQPVTEDQTDRHVETETAQEEPQTVVTEDEEQKPDASKASTLEAAAKPAPAPAVAPEEKKPEAKKSLLSFLKPKAAEPKAAPAPASAAAEPGPAKEDVPKAVKAEATPEAKPATAAPSGGEEPSPPKKLEKRNSITLFFKNLSQKRPSTDAGAPTEAAPAPSAEKTK